MSSEPPAAAETPVACHPSRVRRAGDEDAWLLPIAPGAPDRLSRIRERLHSRAYESEAVRRALARRLLVVGDWQEHRR